MTQDDRIRLEAGWKDALREEFDKPYMVELGAFSGARRPLARRSIHRGR